MAERRYDEKEVAQILSKAISTPPASGDSPTADGISLSELVRVAQEVGISPATIEQAARSLDSDRQDRSSKKTSSVLLEQGLEGELTEETWERLVTELQATTGSSGSGTVTGGTREWRGGSDLESSTFTATARNGRTQLKLMADSSGATAMIGVFGFVFGLLTSMVPLIVAAKSSFAIAPIATLFMTALVIVGWVLGTTAVIQSNRRKMRQHTNELMDRLVDIGAGGITNANQGNQLIIGLPATPVLESEADALRQTLGS